MVPVIRNLNEIGSCPLKIRGSGGHSLACGWRPDRYYHHVSPQQIPNGNREVKGLEIAA
jgi:hypothetical protein